MSKKTQITHLQSFQTYYYMAQLHVNLNVKIIRVATITVMGLHSFYMKIAEVPGGEGIIRFCQQSLLSKTADSANEHRQQYSLNGNPSPLSFQWQGKV
jgi:hypothetical protein